MAEYIKLPDGSYFPVKDGEDPLDAYAAAKDKFPDAFAPKKAKQDTSGFKAAAEAGFENLKGEAAATAAKLGLMDVDKAEEYYKAKKAAAEARFTPTEDGWTESPLLKFKETLGGSLPYMAAPAAAGLAALAAPISAPVAAALGVGAAGALNYGQFVGSNLGAQMGTGKSLRDTDVGAAAAAAVPQALMDTAAMALMPGVGKLFGSVGSTLTTAEARAIAQQTLGKAVADYAAKTGAAMTREGFTEAAQQVFERLQAGLSITDEDARKEYIDSFVGGAALAGAGAPIGRTFERRRAKDQATEADAADRAAQQKALAEQRRLEAEAEEARKQTPEYLLDLEQRYNTAEQALAELKTQVRRAEKGAQLSAEDKAFNKALYAQIAEQKPVLDELGAEVAQRRPEIEQVKQQQAAAAEQARVAGMSPEEFATEQLGAAPSVTTPARPVEGDPFAVVRPLEEAQMYAQSVKQLADNQMLTPPTMGDYLQYALQDPVMADQMVKTRTAMPGMNKRDSAAFLGGLDLHLRQIKEDLSKRVAEQNSVRLAALESEEAEAGANVPPPNEQLAPGVGTEIMALQRMGAKPAGIGDQFGLFGATDTSQSSPAIGQMYQSLTGQDITHTAPGGGPVTRGEQAPFELRPAPAGEQGPSVGQLEAEAAERRKYVASAYNLSPEQQAALDAETARPETATRDNLSSRINRVLSLYDLSPEAEEFLRRVERVLPQRDTELTQDRVGPDGKPVQVGSGSYFQLLSEQLDRIESGQEGVPQKGARRSLMLEGFPTGETRAVTAPPTEASAADIEKYRSARPGQASSVNQQQRAALEKRRAEGVGGGIPGFVYQPKEGESREVKAGAVPVSKRVTEITKNTLRGDSVLPNDLSLAGELNEVLRLQETVADENARVETRDDGRVVQSEAQKSLFPDTEESVKTTRQAFVTYFNSPRIEKLRRVLNRDKEILKRAEKLPELEERARKLAEEIQSIIDKYAEYRTEDSYVRANRELATAKRDIAEIRAAASKGVINRMLLAGRVQQLADERAALLKESSAVGENVDPELMNELDDVAAALQDAQDDLTTLNSALGILDVQMKAFSSLQKMRELMGNTPPPERIREAQKELDALRVEISGLRGDYNDVKKRLTKEAADRRRAEEAVKQAEEQRLREAARVKPSELGINNLPPYTEATQYPALTEAQRMAREKGKTRPTFTTQEEADIRIEPLRAYSGLQAEATRLEKVIRKAQDRSREFLYKTMVQPKKDALERREEKYRNTKSADERAKQMRRLDVARAIYQRAERNFATVPITWVGMKRDIRNAAIAINKLSWFEDEIAAGRIELRKPDETTPKIVKKLRDQQAEARAEAKEAAKRADAPKTSGEALTRSEAAQARKAQKTTYSSKGVAQEGSEEARKKSAADIASAADPEQRASRRAFKEAVLAKQARGEKLNPFEEAILTYSPDMLRGTSGPNDTPLNAKAVGKLEVGDMAGAVSDVATGSANPIARRVAAKIAPIMEANKVTVALVDKTAPGAENAPGSISKDGRRVRLNAQTGVSEESLLHEGVHAATMHELDKPEDQLTKDQREAKKELTQMMEQVKADPDFTNSVVKDGDIHEFVAEGNASKAVQEYMRGKQAPDNRSMWQKFKAAVLRLIGVNVPSAPNMLARFLDLSEKFMVARDGEVAENADTGKLRKQGGNLSNASALEALADKTIATPKTLREKLGSKPLLEAEMQTADMRAALRETLKTFAKATGDDSRFTQGMYNVLKADQKMPMIYATLSMGPLKLYKDAKGFHGVASSNQNSAVDFFKAVAEIPVAPERRMAVAQAYFIAQRAKNKGLSKLDLGALGVTQAELDAALDAAKADPALGRALEKARDAYNAYNKGLIDFNVQTRAMSKELGDKLNAAGDYVPFYRVNENGMAELVFTDDAVVAIGDIRRQPYLAELKGGESKLLPLDQAIFRNTTLLVDKALTNMASKEVAYGLQEIGRPVKKMVIHKGDGPADSRVIRFTDNPDPKDPKDDGKRWIKVDTEGTLAEGVPSELLVRSIEGAHLPLPGFLKVAGAFSDVLRSGVTRMPPYILRQLFRDPMAATFTSGLKYGPLRAVAKAGKNYVASMRGKSETHAKMLEKGLVQSGIFAGDTSDISKLALQIATGKDSSVLDKVFAAADKAALHADAATRSLVYENAIANGLSEVEADMMTMESMNFYKRGLSPLVQYGNRLIPFLNAQIQGLNVLYKAATGQMPFEEQLKIKRKFFNNALFLMSIGLVYAMAMDDDETFKNARPRDKYTNFFLHVPGLDEALKLPIPFEAGYFFSAAVAAVDAMKEETRSREQWQAIRDIFLSSVPGASSMGVPQIVKPVFEVFTNKNFFSGAPVESERLKNLTVDQRYNASTTEMAKALSKALPMLSPVQIDHIVRGYLGTLPILAMSAADGLFAAESKGDTPERRLSETPVFGSLFQKKYGGGDADAVYDLSEQAMQAKATLNNMVREGRREEAKAFREEHREELLSASAAGAYRQLVGRINQDLRRTRERGDLSAAEKAARIEVLEKAKQDAATKFLTFVRKVEEGRTTPQAAR